MSGLVAIRLHGPLADKYGGEHHFAIRSPREAIDALDCNYPGFRRDFLSHPMYGLVVDGDWRNEDNTPDIANAPVSREMDIAPMVEGRLAAAIVPILGYIGITGVAATVLASVITIGLLLGVSLLLTPKPKKKTTEDNPAASQDNYMFSGPENVTQQGVPVPLVYGQCFVGSVVVSAGFEVAEGIGSSGFSWSWSRATAFSAEDRAEPTALDVATARAFLATADEPKPAPVPSGRTWPPYSPGNA